jgi:hypothetical protein
MPEPSILDFIKQYFTPWRKRRIILSQLQEPCESPEPSFEEVGVVLTPELVEETQPEKKQSPRILTWPWEVFLSIVIGLIAQWSLEPPKQKLVFSLLFYAIAVGLLVWGYMKKRWTMPERMHESAEWKDTPVRWRRIFLALPVMVLAFILFGNNQFNLINIAVWLVAIVLIITGFWSSPDQEKRIQWQKIAAFVKNPTIYLHISPTFWVIVVLIVLAVIFRFGQLSEIPGEMFSDHAEKLLDVNDVLNGQYSIFFPRNTGREAVQMYLTAAVAKLFGTGLSFMSLKIGTTLAGFLALPFIYLLAKEIGGKRLGLIAFFLAAIAYWPNVISRVGLRFPLYPLFVAPMLYFLIKGLKYGDRNQFIWAGLALGLGLHGYSPMRIVPIVVVVLLGIYMLFPSAKGKRQQVLMGLVVLAVVAFVVFLPLLRYAFDDPQMFAFRALSRLSTTERAFPASPVLIFFQNLWKSMVMFFWNNGNIWVHSVPNRPAVDVVSAVFLLFGMGITLWRSIRQRSWVDAMLFVSIPLLMLPSILSLAFPEENPSLNRSGGAIIPVFITAAIGIDSLFSSLIKGLKSRIGKTLGYVFAGILIFMTISQNYDLVFRQYKTQFDAGAWNTSEMGAVIRDFAESTGTYDTAYVVPVAYWVDTRLVGINAGVPTKDYAMWPDSFASTLDEPRAKLFLVKGDDRIDLDLLLQYYPDAAVYLYDQSLEGKDFFIVYVPPAR